MDAGSATPSAPTTTTVSLDDSGGEDAAIANDAIGSQTTDNQAAAAPAKEAPAKEAPDPDKLVLEISKRDRESQRRAHAVDRKAAELTKREQELTAKSEAVQKFASLQAKAKSNPYEAAVEIAALLGIDADELTEAVVTKQAGGTVKQLGADERVTRLEKELADKDAKAEEQRKADEAKAAEQQSEARIKQHLGSLESLAKSSENFPLVQGDSKEDLDANVNEAFDLMVLSWQAEKAGQTDGAGNAIKQLTHIQALNIVEKHLREKTEARARKLGLTAPAAKPASTADLSVSSRQTPQASAQAIPRTGMSPIQATSSIKSDDDILADFSL